MTVLAVGRVLQALAVTRVCLEALRCTSLLWIPAVTHEHTQRFLPFLFLWCLICAAEDSSALHSLKTECPAPASRLSRQHVSLQSLLATRTQPEPIHSTVPPDAPKDVCLREGLNLEMIAGCLFRFSASSASADCGGLAGSLENPKRPQDDKRRCP